MESVRSEPVEKNSGYKGYLSLLLTPRVLLSIGVLIIAELSGNALVSLVQKNYLGDPQMHPLLSGAIASWEKMMVWVNMALFLLSMAASWRTGGSSYAAFLGAAFGTVAGILSAVPMMSLQQGHLSLGAAALLLVAVYAYGFLCMFAGGLLGGWMSQRLSPPTPATVISAVHQGRELPTSDR